MGKTSAKEREENQNEPKKKDDGRGKRKAHEWNVLITHRERGGWLVLHDFIKCCINIDLFSGRHLNPSKGD